MLEPVRDTPADPEPPAAPAAEPPQDDQAAAAPLPVPYGLLPGGLSLLLILRARRAALLYRLLLAAACAVTGFLLLAAFRHAAGHPAHVSAELFRPAWCVLPLAAVAWYAVAVAADGIRAAAPGLAAAGLGPARLPLLAAAQTVVTCVLGSAVALVAFLGLRGRLTGSAALPAAGVATLLAVVPLVASVACLIASRPRARRTHTMTGLVCGIAAVAVGLAAELHGGTPPHASHGTVPLPGGLGPMTPLALIGWALVAAGPVVAGPGLVDLTGRLLSAHRPGALRLLSGRALQEDASRIGRPLGVLSAAGCAVVSAAAIHSAAARPPGPLSLLAVAVVVLCPALALACAAAGARHARAEVADTLAALGAAPGLLRSTAVVRAAVLLAVFAASALVLAWLAQPLRG